MTELDSFPIGELPVDAIFSPVKRVNFDVSNAVLVRVPTMTVWNWKLWTDGTKSPEKCLAQAGRIIIEQFKLIAGVKEEFLEVIEEPKESIKQITSENADMPIENLDLSVTGV